MNIINTNKKFKWGYNIEKGEKKNRGQRARFVIRANSWFHFYVGFVMIRYVFCEYFGLIILCL